MANSQTTGASHVSHTKKDVWVMLIELVGECEWQFHLHKKYFWIELDEYVCNLLEKIFQQKEEIRKDVISNFLKINNNLQLIQVYKIILQTLVVWSLTE